MIPKIIHFCWLSNDPFPEKIQFCIDSWKKKLPDYEIIHWDLNRFPLEKSVWVKEAFESKKYALAADYIRCYALYHYGGIYLDSDVEVLKSYNDLLQMPYFMCYEETGAQIEAATIGCEKHFEPFKKMLKYYDNRHFIREDGKYDTTSIPLLFYRMLEQEYTIRSIESHTQFIDSSNTISVLPKDYFSPLVDEELEYLTDRTYSIHHYTASWISPWHRWLRLIILKVFGKKTKKKLSNIYQKIK